MEMLATRKFSYQGSIFLSGSGRTIGKIVRGKEVQVSSVNNNAEVQNSKIYLKAMPLRKLADLDEIKNEVKSGNILIIKVSPLANKSVEDIKTAVNELCSFAEAVAREAAQIFPDETCDTRFYSVLHRLV